MTEAKRLRLVSLLNEVKEILEESRMANVGKPKVKPPENCYIINEDSISDLLWYFDDESYGGLIKED